MRKEAAKKKKEEAAKKRAEALANGEQPGPDKLASKLEGEKKMGLNAAGKNTNEKQDLGEHF